MQMQPFGGRPMPEARRRQQGQEACLPLRWSHAVSLLQGLCRGPASLVMSCQPVRGLASAVVHALAAEAAY